MAKKLCSAGLVFFACAMAPRGVLGQTAVSTRDGVYTKDQAARGKLLYDKTCTSCHGEDLEGGGQTPPVVGDDFLDNWVGQSLADLFTSIQTTMPADHPGTLTKEQAADVLAFLLSANKFPAGKADLPAMADRLKQIHIDKIDASAPSPDGGK